jgi:ABC-2 type transport system permease protein
VYLAALVTSTLIVVALEVVAQILVGRFVLDADWPQAPGSLVLALALGSLSFAALGLALTGMIRSAEGSSAVVNAIYLPATFISGVFFSVEAMPRVLEALAAFLPLTYLLELLRDAFVGGAGVDGAAKAVGILLAWGAAGAALAVRMFHWEPHEG